MTSTDLQQPADVLRAPIAVIPAVRISRPRPGTWRVTASTRGSGPASLAGVLGSFAQDVATDTGIVLDVDVDDAGPKAPDIIIEMDDTGLEGVLSVAKGVRADGLAADDADE